MNILFLSTWFPYPADNGSKLRVYYLLRSLAERHDVTLVSFAFGAAADARARSVPGFDLAQVEVIEVDPFAASRANALVTYASLRPRTSRSIPRMAACVSDLLRKGHWDAIIASTEMMAEYAFKVPASALTVLEEHNSISRWTRELMATSSSSLARARRWASLQKRLRYEGGLFTRFDLVTMVSPLDQAAARVAAGRRPARIEVIPNGVDCDHNQFRLHQKQAEVLVYNGSLTYNVNYEAVDWFLTHVYPTICAASPSTTFQVTGATTGVNLAHLKLDATVQLTGLVPDVREVVGRAAVCVVPIQQGGGTRLKILEAMALGTPVVSTRKGAEGLDVTDGAHLLLADRPGEFAAATLRLLQDAPFAATLAANARRLVEERYDWQCLGAQFADLVGQAATIKGRPQ